MIELTRLNGHLMVVNSDLIKYAESSPDTMLTLINGEKIVVLEPCEEVVQRITAYRAKLLADVLKYFPGDGMTALASVASGASNLRALATEQEPRDNEVPDGRDDAAQQRRRRDRQ
jgi:flagellar protein FlbD